MPRPSRRVDQALLRAGRDLLPRHGCAGLTQRLLAAKAGVQPGMFHYHFRSKDAFLQTLLQQLYEELFAGLAAGVAGDGDPLQRLRRGLMALGTFVRRHAALLGRLLADAIGGAEVVHHFARDNAPRHMGLLLALLQEAEEARLIAPRPPLQRLAFVLGATVLPMLVAPGAAAVGLPMAGVLSAQATTDAALAERIHLALLALQAHTESAS